MASFDLLWASVQNPMGQKRRKPEAPAALKGGDAMYIPGLITSEPYFTGAFRWAPTDKPVIRHSTTWATSQGSNAGGCPISHILAGFKTSLYTTAPVFSLPNTDIALDRRICCKIRLSSRKNARNSSHSSQPSLFESMRLNDVAMSGRRLYTSGKRALKSLEAIRRAPGSAAIQLNNNRKAFCNGVSSVKCGSPSSSSGSFASEEALPLRACEDDVPRD
mmetsp:Transcript_2477/g.6193  ORF Transcript_2477/g.6193 Transcript_2477/m.6193 type:complete len:219 (-) Transcript_2477:446-1102(-)